MAIRLVLALLLTAGATFPVFSGAQSSNLRVRFSRYADAKPRAALGVIDGSRAC